MNLKTFNVYNKYARIVGPRWLVDNSGTANHCR